MRIRDNWLSLLSWRNFSSAGNRVDRSIGKLASGLDINSGADNGAGLAISERFTGQFRGLVQANRNAMDGISLVETGESALNEVSTLLQRGRELAVQAANDVYTPDDKKNIQAEIDQILSEIDRISDVTTFNGNRLLSPLGNLGTIATVMNGLQSSWLTETEKVVQQYYGLTGDGSNLKVIFETAGSDAAWVSGTSNAVTGKLDDLALHINLADMGAGGSPDGGTGPMYDDRKIARALAQAILARNANYGYIDTWFKSGMADFIAGRNEALQADITTHGVSAVVNAMNDVLTNTWVDDSLHRSAAYLAVRYLSSQLSGNMTAFMDTLKTPGNTVDLALQDTIGMSENDFVLDFLANGANFLSTLNLTGPDVGGVNGGDAHAVIPNTAVHTTTPMIHMQVDWSSMFSSLGVAANGLKLNPTQFTLQVGANQGDTMSFAISVVSTFTLDLIGVDVVNAATQAMQKFSSAIQTVSDVRTSLGSVQNRLEHVLNNNTQASIADEASYSRIRDLDFAKEVTQMTRQQLLVASSGAVLAQANTMRQNVMWLLNGVASSHGGGSALLGV